VINTGLSDFVDASALVVTQLPEHNYIAKVVCILGVILVQLAAFNTHGWSVTKA
jgi:hypothetical protein